MQRAKRSGYPTPGRLCYQPGTDYKGMAGSQQPADMIVATFSGIAAKSHHDHERLRRREGGDGRQRWGRAVVRAAARHRRARRGGCAAVSGAAAGVPGVRAAQRAGARPAGSRSHHDRGTCWQRLAPGYLRRGGGGGQCDRAGPAGAGPRPGPPAADPVREQRGPSAGDAGRDDRGRSGGARQRGVLAAKPRPCADPGDRGTDRARRGVRRGRRRVRARARRAAGRAGNRQQGRPPGGWHRCPP
jgi:hypothetical protein